MYRAFASKAVTFLLIVLVMGACVNARTQTLRVSLVALNTARDTMLATSKAREAQIVEHASSKEEGHVQLEAWRATVDMVSTAIDAGYRAIYGAAILDDLQSAQTAGAVVQKALVLLKTLGTPQLLEITP